MRTAAWLPRLQRGCAPVAIARLALAVRQLAHLPRAAWNRRRLWRQPELEVTLEAGRRLWGSRHTQPSALCVSWRVVSFRVLWEPWAGGKKEDRVAGMEGGGLRRGWWCSKLLVFNPFSASLISQR